MQFKLSRAVCLVCIMVMMTACSNTDSRKQAGSGAGSSASSWDADSRNNENVTLGAKSLDQAPQPTMKIPTLDNTKAHSNSQLGMNRDLADQIMKSAQTGSTAVAVTNNNVYVAVDLGGMRSMAATEQYQNKMNDPATGAGLFGSGAGSQLDWASTKSIPPAISNTIVRTVKRAYPEANVFISANPHYVSRMFFYDQQQRQGKSMDNYVNEFNTMVQYAFPDFKTGQNRPAP